MNSPRLIDLPRFLDHRGNLSSIEECDTIPFNIQRAYWIYDVPGGECRGGHAYRRGQELIVALSGSFDVTVETPGGTTERFSLNRSHYGLYVPPRSWRELSNFSTNSLALILSSTPYDETDYIRSHDEFSALSAAGESLPIISSPETRGSVCPIPAEPPTVFDCSLVTLPRITDRAGNITPVHPSVNIPFELRRVFYTYDIPAGVSRGGHAHETLHEFIVAASGSFDVVVDDGSTRRTVTLNRPYMGLHIPPGIWSAEQSFSSGSICLVLASDPFDDGDYIRDYDSFLLRCKRWTSM
ncbi:MAG: FdtA/QdtA family cupin domain-containing protein [Pseudoflavonifractor sp.]|nr:FdtA/QdtA family cupin domain-containing protein [Alloprevotella sp.]MCM1116366.1 FdtA/QdtA family cupin domain-containing protein [Pseudoflavonifractor sp.]